MYVSTGLVSSTEEHLLGIVYNTGIAYSAPPNNVKLSIHTYLYDYTQ